MGDDQTFPSPQVASSFSPTASSSPSSKCKSPSAQFQVVMILHLLIYSIISQASQAYLLKEKRGFCQRQLVVFYQQIYKHIFYQRYLHNIIIIQILKKGKLDHMKSQGAGDKPSYREKQEHVSQWEQWRKLEKKVERIQNIIQVNILRKIDETFQRTEALRNGFNTSLKKIEDNRRQQIRGMKEEIQKLIWENKKEAREEMMNEQQRMKNEVKEQLKIRDQAAAGVNEKMDKQLKEIRGEMQKTKERINTLRTDLSIDNNLLEMPQAEWTILPGACTNNFSIRGNTITLDKYVDGWQQILLDVAVGRVFAFRTRVIHTRGAQLMAGLVDALTQQHQQFSSASTNAICYGAGGAMSYGQLGKKETKYTGDGLGCGTDILVQVQHSTVTFTITHNSVSSHHQLHSGILTQPNRRFVPFVQMWHKGDTVSCHLQ